MLKQEVFLLDLSFLICICIVFLFFSVVDSQIPLGSKLSIIGNEYWVSQNGNFAFGFFNHSDQPNQYSVGIRFNSNSIPVYEQAVIWVAGADVSVGFNSFLQLTQTGDLLLFDSSKGVAAWSSNTSQFSVASAALLDNGNLVLRNGDRDIVWQSFKTPSDTLLPGQNLSASQVLRAASINSVSSYYTLSMDVSGHLRLRWESNVQYWTSGSTSHLIVRAILTSGGALQLLNQRSRPVWSVFGEDHNDSSVRFRFLRLDVDGNLRMYSWNEDSRSWRSVWQAVQNQCNVFATCGEHGICVFTEAGSTLCKCSFGTTTDSNSKCLAPYEQNCNSGTTMVAFKHTFLYGIYPPNDLITQASSEQCKNLCLQDPDCTSVTMTNDGTAQCRMKKTRYITGYALSSLKSVSFVKICLDPVAAFPRSSPTSSSPSPPLLKQSHEVCIPCVIGAASGTLAAFMAIQIGIGLFICRRRKSIRKMATLAYMVPNSRGLIMFSHTEIKDLTENFKHQLGSRVFKGMLQNNQPVAIKDLKVAIEEKQFRIAVSIIGSIHHKNLVKLEGYCCDSCHSFFVYELAANGSVDKWIEDAQLSKRLTWKRRIEICLGVARALCYLHTGCRQFISHGNLKWENVVLDEMLEAKVTEFGLDRVRGGSATAYEDVASFGKMMLILVSGCRRGDDVCEWAYKEWAEGCLERVVDARIEGGVDAEELERTLRLAFWCAQDDERLRPMMGEVVKVLEGTLTVDPPPPPNVCRRLLDEEDLSESDPEP